jgi:hypothetical protein
MVATEVFDELQVAMRVCMVPSLYVPVAVNCCVSPAAIDAGLGATAMETRTGAITDRLDEPVTVPEVALMLVVPSLFPVASPVALTDATAGDEDVHVADAVRFCVLPSV